MKIGRTLVGVGVAAGALAGGALAAERALVRRTRSRPDPDADSGTELTLPTGEVHRLPSHDGGIIATLTRGEGPTIVLSHGVTLPNLTWTKQLRALPAAGFRVVAFDHRGHGDSVVGSSGHSIDNLASDVKTVIDALGITDAVLVGHSMGGIAVQAYVIRHPEHAAAHLRGIVLLSTMARVRIAHMQRLQQVIGFVGDRSPDLSGLFERPGLGLLLARIGFGADPQPAHVDLTRRMIAACPADTTRLATRALLGLDLTAELPAISIPTLVIGGISDLVTPAAESRLMAELIPGARLELFPRAGHMLMFERTDALDALITDFARGLGAQVPLAADA